MGKAGKTGTQPMALPFALLRMLRPYSHRGYRGRVPRPCTSPGCWGHAALVTSPALAYYLPSQHRPFLAISKLGGGRSRFPPLRPFCSPGLFPLGQIRRKPVFLI